MTHTRWIISDTHFGHTNAVEKFKRPDGSPLRDFESVEACDEYMVEQWNAHVKENDTVYHLGDVVIGRRHLQTVKRLNGKKRLVRGNHDLFKDRDYYDVGFEKLLGVSVWTDKFILSHFPLHPASITDRFRVNVHGHTHANEVNTIASVGPGVTETVYTDEPDPRYLCVSVEHTDFRPLSFEEVEERIKARWDRTGYSGSGGWGNGSGPG